MKTTTNPTPTFRTGCWNEDAPIRVGAARVVIEGDAFGPRYIGGDCFANLAITNKYIVFDSPVAARPVAIDAIHQIGGGIFETQQWDGKNWRAVAAGERDV